MLSKKSKTNVLSDRGVRFLFLAAMVSLTTLPLGLNWVVFNGCPLTWMGNGEADDPRFIERILAVRLFKPDILKNKGNASHHGGHRLPAPSRTQTDAMRRGTASSLHAPPAASRAGRHNVLSTRAGWPERQTSLLFFFAHHHKKNIYVHPHKRPIPFFMPASARSTGHRWPTHRRN